MRPAGGTKAGMLVCCILTIGSNSNNMRVVMLTLIAIAWWTRVLPVSVAELVCVGACSLASPLMRNANSSMTLS